MSVMNLNLLPSSAKFQASKIRLQKKVSLVAVFLLSGWVLAIVLAFVLNLITKNQVEAADERYKKANANYMNMTDNIATSQDLKHKAKLVAGVLDKRFEYGKSFEIVKNLFGGGITLDRYGLEDMGLFKLEGTAVGKESVDQLERTIEEINAGEREGLKKARLNGLSLTKGGWKFSMEVTLK